jgi:hypothetical protein
MNPLIQFSLLIILLAFSAHCEAQVTRDTTKLYRVEMKDGNEFIGKILSEDKTAIHLRTEKLGDLSIKWTEITKLSAVEPAEMKNGEHWFDNPQATRYFWSPNGYGLKKGEAYYQNVWVVFNQVSVGLNDYISLGGGLVPLFLFAGAPTPVWITPKVSIPVVENKFNVGGGGLLATIIGVDATSFGILYGITTFGSRDKNLSLGIGYGYAGTDWANTPTFTLSGMFRTGRRGYLLTENYFIGGVEDNLVLLSIGGRRIIKRSGLDFGLFIPSNTGGNLVAIPWLGLTIPLNK